MESQRGCFFTLHTYFVDPLDQNQHISQQHALRVLPNIIFNYNFIFKFSVNLKIATTQAFLTMSSLTQRMFLNYISGGENFSQYVQHKSLTLLNERKYDRVFSITAIQDEINAYRGNNRIETNLTEERAVWFLGFHKKP